MENVLARVHRQKNFWHTVEILILFLAVIAGITLILDSIQTGLGWDTVQMRAWLHLAK